MVLLYQRSVSCWVERLGNELKADSLLLSTHGEVAVRIFVDLGTFQIKRAFWEVQRNRREYMNQGGTIEGLAGIEAFLGAGPAMKRALEGLDEKVMDLVAECTKGLIQAETYVYRERGYATLQEYNEKWETGIDPNYCRYYRNLNRVQTHWPEYVGDAMRTGKLFHRIKTCSVYKKEEGLLVVGSFLDSFHELGVMIVTDGKGVVQSSKIKFLRAPDKVCFESEALQETAPGKLSLMEAGKKELGEHLGGAAGCHHLVDLFYEMGKSVKEVLA